MVSGPLTDDTAEGLSVYYEDNEGFTSNPASSSKRNGVECVKLVECNWSFFLRGEYSPFALN